MQSSILITKERIERRICELGAEISADFKRRNIHEFDFLWLAEGAFIFAADLCREIDVPMRMHSLRVSSYGANLKSNGAPVFDCDFSVFANRNVLLVDDVFDSGATLNAVFSELKKAGVASIRLCVLVEKNISRSPDCVAVDYSAFNVDNVYIIGYGMDCAYNYRNFPDIHILEKQ